MMKQVLVAIALTAVSLFAVPSAGADDWVRGYYRSSGTYVQPHYRSNADGNFYDNWSTRPNVNPHTGQMGTRRTPSYGSYSSPSYRSSTPSRSSWSNYWKW
jgi:hypothetical protein